MRNLWLLAPDLMRMEGAFSLRPPTDKEVAAMLKVGARATVGGLPVGARPEKEIEDISLKKAGAAVRRKKTGDREGRSIILGKEFGTGETRSLEEDALVREQRSPLLKGGVRLGLIKEVFDRSPALERHYPLDPQEGLRWLDVPLDGNIFSVGVKQAEKLYLQSREAGGGL